MTLRLSKRNRAVRSLVATLAVAVFGRSALAAPRAVPKAPQEAGVRFALEDASISFEFSAAVLDELDFWLTPRGETSSDITRHTPPGQRAYPLSMVFEVDATSSFTVTRGRGGSVQLEGSLHSCGAIMSFVNSERVVVVNPSLEKSPTGELRIVEYDGGEDSQEFFSIDSVSYRLLHGQKSFELVGTIHASQSLATRLGVTRPQEIDLGELRVEGKLVPVYDSQAFSDTCAGTGNLKGGVSGWTPTPGPDVIVADLPTVLRYGRIGDITAFAIATVSCNIGDERLSWVSYTNKHPAIFQSAYRLNEYGFQEIGRAWLKHGFYAVSQSLCSPCNDPTNGTELGVGCSDPYSAPLNGDQSNMTENDVVNAHTGYFPYPTSSPAYESMIDRRLQIHDVDLDPARNVGARYFIQGHYITADDAAAGNQDNNASYREVRVNSTSPDVYSIIIDPSFSMRRGSAPIRAWKEIDPDVVESEMRVPGEGLFILAVKTTDLGDGRWRYVYALQNLNSDRSARTFSVEFPSGSMIDNVGFNDVDYHSGETYDGTDWQHVFDGRFLTWSTQTVEQNINANALRFDTVYTFWFECNVPPGSAKILVDLFKPGMPESISGFTIGPMLEMIDCNDNQIADSCDLHCDILGCVTGCGGSIDCNENQVPDECEPDCNENGIADPCDILSCLLGDPLCDDCNSNGVPDGCETDCDNDGLIDDCDPPEDTDGDGVTECLDLCPLTTPAGACLCPAIDWCCFASGMCVSSFPRVTCLELDGTPDCVEAPCRDGCLLGDRDDDGDIDLRDVYELQRCYSAANDLAGYATPTSECLIPFDFDHDGDIDRLDYQAFSELCAGP